ncbi:MAG: hypothetical protein ACU833_02035 [Gammaproteobacteria bacterium]
MKTAKCLPFLLLWGFAALNASAEEAESPGYRTGRILYSARAYADETVSPVIRFFKDIRRQAYDRWYETRGEYDRFVYDAKKGYAEQAQK